MSSATQTQRETTVELGTGKVHVLQSGSGDPLVVLHHDTGTPGWLPIYDDLAKDFTVYVPDLPGFGSSDRLEFARHPRDFAAVVDATLAKLGVSSAAVVGLGFGGWVALEMATQNTSRFKSLAVVGSMGVQPPQGEGEIADQMLIDFVAYAKLGFSNQAKFNEMFGEEPNADQVLIWDYAREVIARIAWKPYMFSNQLTALLKNITIPTVAIWGDNDQVVPISAGRRIVGQIPGAKLETVANAGHNVEIEQPEALAALIRANAQRS